MKKNKQLPVYGLIIIDVIMTLAFFGIFITYEYIIPQKSDSNAKVVLSDEEIDKSFKLPSINQKSADSTSIKEQENNTSNENENQIEDNNNNSKTTQSSRSSKQRSSKSSTNNRSNENTQNMAADKNQTQNITSTQINSTVIKTFKSDSADITVYQKTYGEGENKVTYYVADCYVTSAAEIKTYLAENTYGKNIKESITDMDTATGSVLSINGDFYGNSESGIVIRNGVEYRNNSTNADICVLFKDGTIKTYSPTEFNSQEVIKQGAWQAWCFGPSLLDGNGNVLSEFNTTTFINSTHPRTALGYIEPGHYIFAVVDGRSTGYSKGVTISELAALMKMEGCKEAYNMDGGNSSMMSFQGTIINKPSGNGREISDIIYIG